MFKYSFLLSIIIVSGVSNAQTPSPTPTCPSGQHWDSSMGMCMPDATPAPTPSCPDGQFWDITMNMCMPIPVPTTFRGISRNIFTPTCITCHHANQPDEPSEGGIDFSSYTGMTLANQSTTNPKHAPFIIAGDPEHSKLYLALKNNKMPATEDGPPGPKLPDALIQNVYDWIKAGALNN